MNAAPRPLLGLSALWLAHTTRCLADFTILGSAILARIRQSSGTPSVFDPPAELVGLTLLVLLPAIVLAPLAAHLGRYRWLLPGAAAWNLCGAALAWAALLSPDAVLVWVGCGLVVFRTVRRAVFADLASAARQPLALVNAAFGLGTLLGLLAATYLLDRWTLAGPLFGVVLGAGALSLLVCLLVPSGPPGATGSRGRVFRDRLVRNGLIGQALAFGALLAIVWLFLFQANPRTPGAELTPMWALLGGAFLALVPQFLQFHPYRVAGLAFFGALLLAVGCVWAGLAPRSSPSLALAAAGAVMAIVALRSFTAAVSSGPGASGIGEALNALAALPAAALVVAVGWLGLDPLWGWLTISAVAVIGAALAWWVFLRETGEIVAELLIWPWNRVRAVGPGLANFPVRGPVLVIGNHAAFLDPLWVCKVLPTRLMPMMAAMYYDLPVLRWLMPRIGTIRVPYEGLRREAPEIREAVAVLKRGEGVLIFPEGWLRRHDDRPVRRFGRGVWQILAECPDVPVYALWIEGAWGSYTSWKGGPPMKGKRLDWRKPIDIAVPTPVVVPPEILADHLATRQFLLSKVLESRAILGLPPLDEAMGRGAALRGSEDADETGSDRIQG